MPRTDIDRAIDMFKSMFPDNKNITGEHDEEKENTEENEGSIPNES